jgi:hypothetical protein
VGSIRNIGNAVAFVRAALRCTGTTVAHSNSHAGTLPLDEANMLDLEQLLSHQGASADASMLKFADEIAEHRTAGCKGLETPALITG